MKVQNEEEVNDKELTYVENSEDLNDPYGNLLDFNTPIDQNVSSKFDFNFKQTSLTPLIVLTMLYKACTMVPKILIL